MNWRDQAACIGEDVELFFAVGSSGPALDQIEWAKAMCDRCKVSAHCLEWAIATNQQDGVWGGKSEDERRTLRRNRQRHRNSPPKPASEPRP